MRSLFFTFTFSLSCFLMSCSEESDIADVPCRIISVKEDGKITVTPFVKDGNIVYDEYTGWIQGVGRLEGEDLRVLKDVLTRQVDPDYVTAGVTKNGELSVLTLDTETNKAVYLSDVFHELARKEKP
jgi:hypothetical protein